VVASSVLREAESFWTVQKECFGVDGEIVVERRREWTPEGKAPLMAEVEAEDAQISVVAQRHGISKSLLYNWRSAWKAAGLTVRARAVPPAEFVQLWRRRRRIRPEPAGQMTADAVCPPGAGFALAERVGVIEIDLPDGVRVRVDASVNEKAVRRVRAQATEPKLSARSELAEALRYIIKRRTALTRFAGARLEADSNIAENAIRGIALGRRNWLFTGSQSGGERAAAMYSILQTAKLNGVNPVAYLTDTLSRIAAGHPINRISELMPWAYQSPIAEATS
jgi:transposase-like protein